MKLNVFVIGSCCALLVGCMTPATAPMTSASLDAEAKTFSPEPGKANIYVNRDGRFAGSAVTLQPTLDGRITGLLAPNTFLVLSVSPGLHVLSAIAEVRQVDMLRIKSEAESNYFFNAYVESGWSQGFLRITPMSEEEGRNAVAKSKRAEAMTYQP